MVWCMVTAPKGEVPPISWVDSSGSTFFAGSAVWLLAINGSTANAALTKANLMFVIFTNLS